MIENLIQIMMMKETTKNNATPAEIPADVPIRL